MIFTRSRGHDMSLPQQISSQISGPIPCLAQLFPDELSKEQVSLPESQMIKKLQQGFRDLNHR